MTRNLLLTGGPTHDFESAAAAIVELLGEHEVDTAVAHEPGEAVRLLEAATAGEVEPFSLVTVHALRWRMEEPRFAGLRDRWATSLGAEAIAVLDRFVRSGGGLLALHTAVICFDADPIWHELCGASWSWERSAHPPLGDATVAVTEAGRVHPITAGLADFEIRDEVYGFLDRLEAVVPLLSSDHGGETHPVLWARELGAGRVVTDLLGHDPSSFAHPAHRTVLARAATWAVGKDPATVADRGAHRR